MAEYLIQSETLTGIADAIRNKEGSSANIPVLEMAEKILAIEGGGSGSIDHSLEDGIIRRTLTSYSNDRITTIGAYAFANFAALKSIDFPNVTSIKRNAFYTCNGLTSVVFPKVVDIGTSAFNNCSSLDIVDFHVLTTIAAQAFQYSTGLYTVIIRSPNVPTLSNINAFYNMPVNVVSSGTPGYVYVPSALVDSYKSASNWSNYADKIRAIEDYPEITGG